LKVTKRSGERILDNYRLMDLLIYCEEAIGDTNCEEIKACL